MKKTIRRYAAGELMKIKETLSNKNKESIENFLKCCSVTAGESKLKNIERVMIKICDILESDLNKLNLEKLREFLAILKNSDLEPATKNEMKKFLKRYIRDNFEDWNNEFKGLRDIRLEKDWSKRVTPDTTLSKEEIQKLVSGTDSIKFKALIMAAYETAARTEEILKRQWKDVNLETGEIKIHSSKKNTDRTLLLIDALPHIKRLKDEWTFGTPREDDFIFVTKNPRKPMSNITYETTLKRLGRNILKKDIFPYLLRHSKLTEMQKITPPKIYEKFADHSLGMASRYSKLKNKDVVDFIRVNVGKIKPLSAAEKDELETLREDFASMKETLTILLKNARITKTAI